MMKTFQYKLFQDTHKSEIKKLVGKYLVPTALARLGLVKNDVQNKDFHGLREILDPDLICQEKFKKVSMVAVDENDKVIACQLNYFLTKKDYNHMFIDIPTMFSKRDTNCQIAKFAKHRVELMQDLEFFDRHNAERLLYLAYGIVHPDYRNQRLASTLLVKSFQLINQNDGVLALAQIPVGSEGQSADNAFKIFKPVRELVSYDNYIGKVFFINKKMIEDITNNCHFIGDRDLKNVDEKFVQNDFKI